MADGRCFNHLAAIILTVSDWKIYIVLMVNSNFGINDMRN